MNSSVTSESSFHMYQTQAQGGPGTYPPLGKQVLNMYIQVVYFRAEEPKSVELRALEAG